MYVELLIDKSLGLPLQIRFFNVAVDEKTSQVTEETFSYTIKFEESYLNNGSKPDSFFEISSGYEMHDVTEQYLEDHHSNDSTEDPHSASPQ